MLIHHIEKNKTKQNKIFQKQFDNISVIENLYFLKQSFIKSK